MIKNFIKFCESISGQELVGHFGPNYGDQKLPTTLTSYDTSLIRSEIDGKVYSEREYQDIYNEYLKSGGKILNGFNKENLEQVITWNSKKR